MNTEISEINTRLAAIADKRAADKAAEVERKKRETFFDPTESVADRIVRLGVVQISDARLALLADAHDAQAVDAVFLAIADANRVRKNSETIELPKCRYHKLSRGTSWCKEKDGGFINSRDHVVSAGRYVVGGSDGFSRKERLEWRVEHIQVGGEIWTIAN